MTYNQTIKEIERLQALANEVTITYVPRIARKTVCEGHGMFFETDELKLTYDTVKTPKLTAEEHEEVLAKIAALEETIKEEREHRALAAKAKRYRKELEEMAARRAYLEDWLNVNDF